MKRLFNPMLFFMANTPDVERNMELLVSLLQTAADSVRSIKSGFDNFNATVIKVAESMPGSCLDQNKPAGPAEPADAAPSIQMPDAKA